MGRCAHGRCGCLVSPDARVDDRHVLTWADFRRRRRHVTGVAFPSMVASPRPTRAGRRVLAGWRHDVPMRSGMGQSR